MGIFGSIARNEQHAESDVDVYLEGDVLSLLTMVHIKNDLEELFKQKVNLVRQEIE